MKEVRRIRIDTLVGMAVSNLIATAKIMTTAATLHRTGKTNIGSSAQAAEALKPVAVAFAELIFALGIIGTGLLAIPVLAALRPTPSARAANGPSGFRTSRKKPWPATAFSPCPSPWA
jgi:Mn2+/Fe2+ NRAMP family transporter